ncbi:MAG TPA: hypothetical protein VIK01_29600 [Polyangiaceae bacterium]
MSRPPSDAIQIAIRVPADWLKKADQVAAEISQPGFQASRTDGFRAALARGFDAFLGEAPADGKKPSRKK